MNTGPWRDAAGEQINVGDRVKFVEDPEYPSGEVLAGTTELAGLPYTQGGGFRREGMIAVRWDTDEPREGWILPARLSVVP